MLYIASDVDLKLRRTAASEQTYAYKEAVATFVMAPSRFLEAEPYY